MITDFSTTKKVHFIGIGGVGISALARLMVHEGKEVSGTNDSQSPETLDELRNKGVVISLDQDPQHLPDADMYVYSDAWLTNNPAMLEAARSKNVPVLNYAQALGIVANNYFLIAVSGAHGKTTTTAMLAKVLIDAKLDPTVVVGSILKDQKSNFVAGKSKYFVVEADEYRRHFHELTPSILVILNIDDDHLDYYKDIEEIKGSFKDMISKVVPGGHVVCDLELPHVEEVVKDAKVKVVDYELFGDQNIKLKVPGAHNVSNAAAVFAVADILEIPRAEVKKSLEGFAGTWRRFEYKGETSRGALVYDDYGHHPTEVDATLSGARELFPDKRLTVIFQPHLYSRTKQHLKHFGTSFNHVDSVIIAPIYGAREAFDPSITSEMLAQEISNSGISALAMNSFEEIETYLGRMLHEGDVIITMGAGDIYKIGEKLLIAK